jgi:energy-converting hydrogenase Eha subunit A
MMKLQYDDSIDEATDVQYELAELTGVIRSRKWIGFVVPVLVVGVTLFLFWHSPLQLIAGMILAAVVLGLDLLTYKNKIRHSFRKSLIKARGSASPVTTEYQLDESGISIRQLGQEMKCDWSTVVGFHCTPDRIKLVLQPPGIVAIPTRAFSSVQQREQWVTKIESSISRAV